MWCGVGNFAWVQSSLHFDKFHRIFLIVKFSSVLLPREFLEYSMRSLWQCTRGFPIAMQFEDRIAADDSGVTLQLQRGATASWLVRRLRSFSSFTLSRNLPSLSLSLSLSPSPFLLSLSVTFRKFRLLEKSAGRSGDDVKTASSESRGGEEKLVDVTIE